MEFPKNAGLDNMGIRQSSFSDSQATWNDESQKVISCIKDCATLILQRSFHFKHLIFRVGYIISNILRHSMQCAMGVDYMVKRGGVSELDFLIGSTSTDFSLLSNVSAADGLKLKPTNYCRLLQTKGCIYIQVSLYHHNFSSIHVLCVYRTTVQYIREAASSSRLVNLHYTNKQKQRLLFRAVFMYVYRLLFGCSLQVYICVGGSMRKLVSLYYSCAYIYLLYSSLLVHLLLVLLLVAGHRLQYALPRDASFIIYYTGQRMGGSHDHPPSYYQRENPFWNNIEGINTQKYIRRVILFLLFSCSTISD